MIQLCNSEIVIDILETKVGVPASTLGIETTTWEELGVDSLSVGQEIERRLTKAEG